MGRRDGRDADLNQIEWRPFGHSAAVLLRCGDRGIVIRACGPLTRTEWLDDGALRSIAAKYDQTPVQLLIRWNLQLGTVPRPQAHERKHLEGDVDVFDLSSDNDLATLSS